MSAFTVEFQNEPGALAQLCETMAARQVNIVICGITHGDTGTVAFIADDEASARTAITDASIAFTEHDTLTVNLDNVPGAGAAAFRKLADASVNVELLLPVRVSDQQFRAVIATDNQAAARAALGAENVSD